MRRLLSRPDERGMTLIEIMVSITLLVIVGPMVAGVMVSTLRAGTATEDQSRVVDELRQQMYAVSRELRSARCVTAPTAAAPIGDTLTFSTESQTGSGNSVRYLRYEVDTTEAETYLVRTELDDTGAVIGSRVVGPGLVASNTTFELRSTPRKSVIVKLRLQLGVDRPVQEVTTTIAGRNAWLTC